MKVDIQTNIFINFTKLLVDCKVYRFNVLLFFQHRSKADKLLNKVNIITYQNFKFVHLVLIDAALPMVTVSLQSLF